MKFYIYLVYTFSCVFFGVKGFTQITVTPSSDAQSLAESLVSDEINILSASLTCAEGGAGSFAGGSEINVSEGVILTSGLANNAIGPNDLGGVSRNNGAPGDLDLSALVNNATTNDACILEFTFTAPSNTIGFSYLFGSDEYEEYFCSSFIDVIGFFISGPNPFGGSYDKQNIAVVQNATVPINLSSVGPSECDNVSFVDLYNGNGVNDATRTDEIQYDGYTDLLSAVAFIIPNQEYTIKVGVADVADGSFDSGVFLKATSFSSDPCDAFALNLDAIADKEVCTSGISTFTVNTNTLGNIGVEYKVEVTGDIGTTDGPENFRVLPTDGSSLTFTAVENNTGEDIIGTIIITAARNLCGDEDIQVIDVVVKSGPNCMPETATLDMINDITLCPGAMTTFSVNTDRINNSEVDYKVEISGGIGTTDGPIDFTDIAPQGSLISFTSSGIESSLSGTITVTSIFNGIEDSEVVNVLVDPNLGCSTFPATIDEIDPIVVCPLGTSIFTVNTNIPNNENVDYKIEISGNIGTTDGPMDFTDLAINGKNITFTAAENNTGSIIIGTIMITTNFDGQEDIEVIDVIVNICPEIEVDEATVGTDLGPVVISQTGSQTYTITNTGTANLEVSSITSSDGQFVISDFTPNSSIAPLGTLSFDVDFTPTSTGAQSATITINSNDADEAMYTFGVSGTGTSPEIEVDEATIGADLGPVVISQTGSQTYTITNAGTANLEVSSITSSDGQFVISDFTPNSSIAPSSTLSFDVDFTPTSTGAQSATITINSNDADEAMYTFEVSGEGVNAAALPWGSTKQLLILALVLLMLGSRALIRVLG